jgi:NAD+ synthase
MRKIMACRYGRGRPNVVGITPEQVQMVFDDIDTKRRTTRYLHLPALLIEEVQEVENNIRQD